jgi:hypothetical protein
MRQLFVIAAIALVAFSCGQSDKKTKESGTTTAPVDTANTQPAAITPPADSTKTVNLTFSGYDEGDYAHLIFTETGTGTDYDFGHPDDNNLDNIAVVLKDDKTAFGYKENSKMKGAKFVATLIYKMTDTYDGNGQPMKGKEWRITSLKKAD